MINENKNLNYEYLNVTVLLSVFTFVEKEMIYWKKTFYELKENNVKVQVLVDNPKLKEKCEKWFEDFDVFVNKKNLGKLSSVYWHIRDGNVITKYFKSVDPDDYISIQRFLTQKMVKIDSENIIIDEMLLLEKGIDDFSLIEKIASEVENKSFFPVSFANNAMMLPVNPIKKDRTFKRRKKLTNFADDQIIGCISLKNGSDVIYRKKEESKPFYLYLPNNGFSDWKDPVTLEVIADELVKTMGYWIKIMKNQPIENLVKNNWPQFDIFDGVGKLISKRKNTFSKKTFYKYLFLKRKKIIINMIGKENLNEKYISK